MGVSTGSDYSSTSGASEAGSNNDYEGLSAHHQYQDSDVPTFSSVKREPDLTSSGGKYTSTQSSVNRDGSCSSLDGESQGAVLTDKGGKSRKRNPVSQDVKQDQVYLKKRRKNNESAKKSRDARRNKEEKLFVSLNWLEIEYKQLSSEVMALKSHVNHLRNLVSKNADPNEIISYLNVANF